MGAFAWLFGGVFVHAVAKQAATEWPSEEEVVEFFTSRIYEFVTRYERDPDSVSVRGLELERVVAPENAEATLTILEQEIGEFPRWVQEQTTVRIVDKPETQIRLHLKI